MVGWQWLVTSGGWWSYVVVNDQCRSIGIGGGCFSWFLIGIGWEANSLIIVVGQLMMVIGQMMLFVGGYVWVLGSVGWWW